MSVPQWVTNSRSRSTVLRPALAGRELGDQINLSFVEYSIRMSHLQRFYSSLPISWILFSTPIPKAKMPPRATYSQHDAVASTSKPELSTAPHMGAGSSPRQPEAPPRLLATDYT